MQDMKASLIQESLQPIHNAFIYGIVGETVVNDVETKPQPISKDQLAILSQGNTITLTAGSSDSRFLFVSGKPLNEPVARGGPFVMNTGQVIFNHPVLTAITR